jgi:hypothetical protein
MGRLDAACCADCVFWAGIKDPVPAIGYSPGQCRRYAPKPRVTSVEPEDDPFVLWPMVEPDYWCGEFESDK